ncbi:MAG: hydrogenase maturation protease [Flavobacteriaceae bacterium]|nr:hydrogenase maturation protease [Flavobacteriaceae bacterium]
MKREHKTLIFGIGNVGRKDDGIGWAFLDNLKAENIDCDIAYRYQLQVEDAELLCNYEKVIFIDSSKEDIDNGFYFKTCESSDEFSFSTHQLAPQTVLFLAEELYQHSPKAFILGVQGYQWNLEQGLSEKAKINLDTAKTYLFESID